MEGLDSVDALHHRLFLLPPRGGPGRAHHFSPVLRVRDILDRIRGSVPLTNGSEDPIRIRLRILLFSLVTVKMATKINFFLFFLLTTLLFEATFTVHYFSNIKNHKKVTKE